MLRILLIILVIAAISLCIRRMLVKTGNGRRNAVKQVAQMVRCSHCDLHLAEEDALHSNGQYFCSREHLAAVEKKND